VSSPTESGAAPSQLLDPAFLQELSAMRRLLRPRARSAATGAHLGKRRGGQAEFAEHRAYVAGDDPRRVDWAAFARTGSPVVKVFRAEEDTCVRLVVDASASLAFGAPPKLLVAKKIAAGLAYVALAESERAEVACAREHLSVALGPTRGRAAIPRVLAALDALRAEGGTGLADALDETLVRYRRPGMLVILSDFMDSGPWDAAVGRAHAAGHEVALVQVLAREELEPDGDGDVALVDSETGDVVELTFDDATRDAYEARLGALFERLAALATKVRGSYTRAICGDDVVGPIGRVLTRTVDRWATSSS